jgi:hypothetical protein
MLGQKSCVVLLCAMAFAVCSSCHKDPLSGLEYVRFSDNEILIKSGFPYNSEVGISRPQTLHILHDENGKLVARGRAMMIHGGVTTDGISVQMSSSNYIGCSYVFDEIGLSVTGGEFRYTSNREGATISFRDDGVLVSGFDIEKIGRSE